jgi:SAM-dependent methyltransferase
VTFVRERSVPACTLSLATNPPTVWERVWRNAPTDERDDALLARERGSPRARLVEEAVRSACGGFADLRTIELGSGRGDASVLLAERGADVTLLDATEPALALARRRFDRLGLRARFVQGDLFRAGAEWAGVFDLAISLGVIEHFRGPVRTLALESHARVLRPGGVVVVSVPNAHCLPYRLWKAYLERRGCWPYGPEIPYTARELRVRARRSGIVDVRVHALNFLQSLGECWVRPWHGVSPAWSQRPSRWDAWMGMNLVLIGRRAGGR